MTYSIVARDEQAGQLGVAVQSHFFGVGRLVTWAVPGVGAVATQAFVDPSYGPRGLELMRAGLSAPEALAVVVAADPGAAQRQAAMIDATGRAAAHTGGECYAEADQADGPGASAQGNMLRSADTPQAMIDAFESTGGDLAGRLLAALDAAERCGGDARGRESAALLVVSGERQEVDVAGVAVDLRVDDDDDPLAELRRLLELSRAYDELRPLFMPGLLSGAHAPADADVDEAVGGLDRASAALPGSAEPLMWKAVVLARAGRADDARTAAGRAVAINADLSAFFARLANQGIIPEKL
jgi:uncharacterized Ntn-hydrolase superfamily protein